MPREKYSADEDFTIQGHWERPGGAHRVAGTLERKDASFRLNLLGAFDDGYGEDPFRWSLPDMAPSVIHGKSSQGTPITLLKSFYKNVNWESDILARPPFRARHSTLISNAMLLGMHLAALDDDCFTECSLTFPNLDRWLDDRPFNFDFSPSLGSMQVKYNRPPERSFWIGKSFGKLTLRTAFSPPGNPWDDVTIRSRTYIHIEPSSPKSFSWFVRTIGHAQRLFTLLFGRVVQATQIRLLANTDEENDDEAYAYISSKRQEQTEMDPIDFVFRYPDIHERFRRILESWFSESEAIQHALDLVFASLERPAPFLETKFLPFAQAVEVYSRTVVRGQYVDKQTYKPIRKGLIDSIPKGTPGHLKKAIMRTLGYANEWSLRERFTALLDTLETKTHSLFCLDPNDFVKGIVETRNQLIHYSSRSRKVLKGIELHWATLKLQLMMKVILLIRLGIPEATVRELFGKDHTLSHERQAWSKVSEIGSEANASDDDE